MKKRTKIFGFIFSLEIIILLAIAFFSGKSCSYPTPCDVPSFFNPFGYYDVCIQVVTPFMQCNLFALVLIEWVILFTAIAYIIYLIKNKKVKK